MRAKKSKLVVLFTQPKEGIVTVGNCFHAKGYYTDIWDMDSFEDFPEQQPTQPHYIQGTYEPIKVIQAWDLNFNLGNVVKYIARAGKKGETLPDLIKARDYINYEIQRHEQL